MGNKSSKKSKLHPEISFEAKKRFEDLTGLVVDKNYIPVPPDIIHLCEDFYPIVAHCNTDVSKLDNLDVKVKGHWSDNICEYTLDSVKLQTIIAQAKSQDWDFGSTKHGFLDPKEFDDALNSFRSIPNSRLVGIMRYGDYVEYTYGKFFSRTNLLGASVVPSIGNLTVISNRKLCKPKTANRFFKHYFLIEIIYST